MEPKNYDKEILVNRCICRHFGYNNAMLWVDEKCPQHGEPKESRENHFQNFTDGFVGAMALVGIITIGYQVIKLLVSLFK